MKDYRAAKNFDELIELEHGKIGTKSRNKYEVSAQMFIISEMLKEVRKEANLTQEELAQRAGTKKSYISKLENGKRKREYPTFYLNPNLRTRLEPENRIDISVISNN